MKEDLALNLEENARQIEENFFPTDRGLNRKGKLCGTSYFSYHSFGPALREGLLALKGNDLWVDVGGGELFAQNEYFESFKPGIDGRVGVISVADPQTEDFRRHLGQLRDRYPDRFFYTSGGRIEDIPDEELPWAKVVSDLFAALTFTDQIDTVLERELSMLEPGGLLVARLQKAFIRDGVGKRFGIKRYLERIEGAELSPYGYSFYTVIMRRTRGEIRVPKLELVNFLSYKNAPNPNNLDPQFIFCERYYNLVG